MLLKTLFYFSLVCCFLEVVSLPLRTSIAVPWVRVSNTFYASLRLLKAGNAGGLPSLSLLSFPLFYVRESPLWTLLRVLSCNLLVMILRGRLGYGAQGAEPSRKSSSAPACVSVGWSTFLAVLPFISVRPSRRLEAQAEGLKSVIYSVLGYCGSWKLATTRRQNHLACSGSFTLHPFLLTLPSRYAPR